MSKAIFEQIAKAAASKSGVNIRSGKYVLELGTCSVASKFGGTMAIHEFTVLEACSIGQLDRTGKAIEPNQPGTSCSQVINLDKKDANGPGDCKSFAMAVFGVAESEITADELGELYSPMAIDKDGKIVGQPAKGLRVELEAFVKPQKKDPSKDFTHLRFTHIEPTDADLAGLAAKREAERATLPKL